MGEGKANRIEDEKALEQIALDIKEVKHGYVEMIVQDLKVIQINRTEKIRLDKLDRERADKL